MKVILFDFFGVFSTPVYLKVVKKHLPSISQDELMHKLDLLDIGQISEENLVSEISQRSGVPQEEIWMDIKNEPIVNIELIAYVRNTLKGNYKIGLLTNIPKSLLIRIFGTELSLFDYVFISSELKMIKPHNDIFEHAISMVGCAPGEILFIDDGLKNVEAAKSLGLHSFVYTGMSSFKSEIETFLR